MVNSRKSKFNCKIEELAFDPLLYVCLYLQHPSLIVNNPMNDIFFMNELYLFVYLWIKFWTMIIHYVCIMYVGSWKDWCGCENCAWTWLGFTDYRREHDILVGLVVCLYIYYACIYMPICACAWKIFLVESFLSLIFSTPTIMHFYEKAYIVLYGLYTCKCICVHRVIPIYLTFYWESCVRDTYYTDVLPKSFICYRFLEFRYMKK